MYVGIGNPNVLGVLKKMQITNTDKGKTFTVLYNPQSYQHNRSVEYAQDPPLHSDQPLVQFLNGKGETLSFDLFFDSFYAGAEVGGVVESVAFGANSLLPSLTKLIDIREYTKKVYHLARVDANLHRPPKLKVEWSSLSFTGFLVECQQNFIKFNELGKPVRAILKCTFLKFTEKKYIMSEDPLNSPDTTKFHRVQAGDSLWALALAEYGDSGAWRHIAAANGIANPRLLHPGDIIRIPALTD